MYRAYGLLTPDTDFSLSEAARRLSAKFPSFAVEQEGEKVVLSSEEWEIHLTVNAAEEVLTESRDMAEHIAGRADGAEIASCARRVEVESDIPDPEMDHFNKYLMVIEVLQSFKGLIAVDPQEPSLL